MILPVIAQGAEFMRKIIACVALLAAASSCGTVGGVLDGTGSVLEGMATDVRSVGSWVK